MTTTCRALLLMMVGLLVATLAPVWTGVSASGRLSSPLAKKKCVVKKVHGKKKKVCKKVSTPTPTPTPAPHHLIDANGYLWIDGSGHVYVSSGYLASGTNTNGWVSKLSSTGALLATFRSRTTLDGASGVAVDEAGNVYVADLGGDRVVKFASSGREVGTLGTPLVVAGELSAPSGMGLDGVGHLYVADSNPSRIQEFTLDGQFVGTIGSFGANSGELDRPLDVVVDGHGDLFVADSNNSRIEEFSPAGTVVTIWGTEGSDVGQFDHPKGIALDAAGNVYVADTGNRRVQKFSSDGTPLQQWSTGDREPVSPGVDASGNVYVTEDLPGGKGGYGVAKYSPDGRLVSLWQ